MGDGTSHDNLLTWNLSGMSVTLISESLSVKWPLSSSLGSYTSYMLVFFFPFLPQLRLLVFTVLPSSSSSLSYWQRG